MRCVVLMLGGALLASGCRLGYEPKTRDEDPGDASGAAGDAGGQTDAAPRELPVCVDDDLGSAQGLELHSGSLAGQGDDFVGSCGGMGPDIHLYWTAPENGRFRFLACGNGGTDLVLYARSTCLSDDLACSDDWSQLECSGGFLPPAGFDLDLEAGESLVLIVDLLFGSGGGYALSIERVGDAGS